MRARRASLAFETTLSGRGHVKVLHAFRQCGYRIELNYLWIPSAEFSEGRVASRVANGGHDIPAEAIARRYGKSICNLRELYTVADHEHKRRKQPADAAGSSHCRKRGDARAGRLLLLLGHRDLLDRTRTASIPIACASGAQACVPGHPDIFDGRIPWKAEAAFDVVGHADVGFGRLVFPSPGELVETAQIAVNERLFLGPGPKLELSLTPHGFDFGGEGFGIDQSHRPIPSRIRRSPTVVVINDAFIKIRSVADIEGAIGAFQYVDV